MTPREAWEAKWNVFYVPTVPLFSIVGTAGSLLTILNPWKLTTWKLIVEARREER